MRPAPGAWLVLVTAVACACAAPVVTPGSASVTPSVAASASASGSATVAATAGVTPSEASPAVSPSAAGGEVPDVLKVTCTATGTEVDSQRAAIQQDGLHIHIRNTSGTDRAFDIEDVGGDAAPTVEGLQVWPLRPGEARFSCGPPGSEPVAVEIVDPAGYYVSDVISCASAATATIDYAEVAEGPKGDLLTVARTQIHGLRIGDRVELAGYVRSLEPRVRVANGDQIVAVASYRSDGAGGWLLTTTSVCAGTGLSWGP